MLTTVLSFIPVLSIVVSGMTIGILDKDLFVEFLEKEEGWGGGVLTTTLSSTPFCLPVVAGMTIGRLEELLLLGSERGLSSSIK